MVIPLERLSEYTDAIERINIELSTRNKLELLDALDAYFSGEIKTEKTADVDMRRKGEARELLTSARAGCRFGLEGLECYALCLLGVTIKLLVRGARCAGGKCPRC